MSIMDRLQGPAFNKQTNSFIFNLYSKNASKVDIYFYNNPKDEDEMMIKPLSNKDTSWAAVVTLDELKKSGIINTIYYGYRIWGPNWPYSADWKKGNEQGFICDVDSHGNRFNPNKLLMDPYAKSISHDPAPRLEDIDPNEYADEYYTGPGLRSLDTGRIAPKCIAFTQDDSTSYGNKPLRMLKDDIIYEVHLRYFTKLDDSINENLRGTYKGAGLKAPYLKKLGITAIQLMPVFEFADEQNDDDNPAGDNGWGYMPLSFFAPNRRYSFDKSPAGPIKEFKEMVSAFHSQGIKVFLDVVYNHTGEGLLKRKTNSDSSRNSDELQEKDKACLLFLRGIDNASYYELRSNQELDNGSTKCRYADNSGCGPNLNFTNPQVVNLVMDSLQYWSSQMGVDGFRFDLAPVLANTAFETNFIFKSNDPANILNRAVKELPARSLENPLGADLIAEPWAIGEGTYQLGNFPKGWSEWNDQYREAFRKAENSLNPYDALPPELANFFSGSYRQFKHKQGASPSSSVNYVVSHDGYNLRDLFTYTNKNWHRDNNNSQWLTRKAVRNIFTILCVSAGVPMICGGDELYRTTGGHTNSHALDNELVWLKWETFNRYCDSIKSKNAFLTEKLKATDEIKIYEFAKNIFCFRNNHPALRPAAYYSGQINPDSGLKDITWYQADGHEIGLAYWASSQNSFIAFRIDGAKSCDPAASLYIAYNKGEYGTEIILPGSLEGKHWHRVCDTAEWMEVFSNFDTDDVIIDHSYYIHEKSLIILEER